MRHLTSWLGVALVAAVALATFASAQQPASPPWKQGQPPEQASSPLAPHPQPPAPKAAAEIPVSKIKVPQDLKVELWAHGIPNARTMAWGDKGTLFVGSRVAGQVYAIVDKGTTREVKTILKGLTQPNGVAFKDGTLYVAEISRITKYPGIESNLDSPPVAQVVIDTLPKDAPHGWKFLSFGPDGRLYFAIGAPCNICLPPETHAALVSIKPDGTELRYEARGVRNTVGHDFHPVTRELYFTNHARDWLGEDVPNDTLHHVVKPGSHFGYPYCHQGEILDPEFGKGRACSEFNPPILKMGPHVATNGIWFYRGSMLPAQYRNQAFVAMRGSWNRTEMSGFKVVTVNIQPGRPPVMQDFATGWLEGKTFWGRPVYLNEMKDGSLLISDDYAGAIYRVSTAR